MSRAYVIASPTSTLPGRGRCLRALRDAGFLCGITNQSGIARGMFSEADYHTLDLTCVSACGGRSGPRFVQYCPHLPDAEVEQSAVTASAANAADDSEAAALLKINTSQSILMRSEVRSAAGRRAGVVDVSSFAAARRCPTAMLGPADGVYDDSRTASRN